MAHSRGMHRWKISLSGFASRVLVSDPLPPLCGRLSLCKGENVVSPLERGTAAEGGRGSLTSTLAAKQPKPYRILRISLSDGPPFPRTGHTRQEEQTASTGLPQ